MENTETAGGSRYSAGKPGAWWNIPLYGLRLIAPVSERGGEKYAPLDWQEGQSFSTLWNSMTRHFLEAQHRGPWAKDPETGLYHLAHMAWNLLCLLTWMALEKHEYDDITPWRGVTASQAQSAREEAEVEEVTPEDVLRRRQQSVDRLSEYLDLVTKRRESSWRSTVEHAQQMAGKMLRDLDRTYGPEIL